MLRLKVFANAYYPNQCPSPDEGIVPWQGNLSFRVYSPGKLIKYGIRAYMVYYSPGKLIKYSVGAYMVYYSPGKLIKLP